MSERSTRLGISSLSLQEDSKRWKIRCEAYIDQLHQQRLQYLVAKKSNQMSKLGLEGKEKDKSAP